MKHPNALNPANIKDALEDNAFSNLFNCNYLIYIARVYDTITLSWLDSYFLFAKAFVT